METESSQLAFQAPDPAELANLMPGYEIQSLIAVGGMGAVYRAVQISLDRLVAIKILPTELGSDTQFRTQFETEAKAMALLNHPNLAGVYDFGSVDGILYIVMEFVEGESLYHYAYGKYLEPEDAIRFTKAICLGLQHAHENGVLHRDIKPSNILLDSHGQPKVVDFGLAQGIRQGRGKDEEIFGTPHYTAPEVLRPHGVVDARADLFSVGVILHELLTGRMPANDPRSASAIVQCDPRLDGVIRKSTHPNPDLRYSSCAEMAAELDVISQTPPPRTLRTTDLRTTSRITARAATPGAAGRMAAPAPALTRAPLAGGSLGPRRAAPPIRKPLAQSSSSSGSGIGIIIFFLILAVCALVIFKFMN